MSRLTFDTLAYARRLKEGGFTDQQADTLTCANRDILGQLAESLTPDADPKESSLSKIQRQSEWYMGFGWGIAAGVGYCAVLILIVKLLSR